MGCPSCAQFLCNNAWPLPGTAEGPDLHAGMCEARLRAHSLSIPPASLQPARSKGPKSKVHGPKKQLLLQPARRKVGGMDDVHGVVPSTVL